MSNQVPTTTTQTSLPSHEGSGLKSRLMQEAISSACLPSHEGSGLKFPKWVSRTRYKFVSPRMREMD